MKSGRRMWEKIIKGLYKLQNSKSLLLRAQCQTSGYPLTECQLSNNVVRTTMEEISVVMGGVKYLYTNSYEKAVGMPTL